MSQYQIEYYLDWFSSPCIIAAACEDVMSHVSSTNYLVCGSEVRDFVIRKSETFNDIALSGSLWKTEEQVLHQGKLTLELVKVETM